MDLAAISSFVSGYVSAGISGLVQLLFQPCLALHLDHRILFVVMLSFGLKMPEFVASSLYTNVYMVIPSLVYLPQISKQSPVIYLFIDLLIM